MLADPRFSRAEVLERDVPRPTPQQVERPGTLVTTDPPEHGRLRRLVAGAFTHRRAESMRPRIRGVADELVDEMLAGDKPADLVAAVSMPLPVNVICELLGVPREDRHVFHSGAILSDYTVPADEREATFKSLADYLAELIAERRARPEGPGDDVLGALISARDADGDRLSEEELIELWVDILVAGYASIMSVTPDMVVTLLTERDRWYGLVADPGGVPDAVEEMLRVMPTIIESGHSRVATEDVEIAGGTVRAGEAVLPCLPAANRDPAVFDAPEEMRLGRDAGKHIAFGFGPHYCLGASLARVQLQSVLTALVEKVPTLDLVEAVREDSTRVAAAVQGQLLVTW
ncbi:cytochrome P450 [Saccharopolyspora erythraea]|uniref:cytochrome P450 n=1 Tax=Saccharopolyspora erythraea TaxID=1836 RepID=UPI002011E6A1|nr:cytochrome P450 [Saccharopolyspora erythraea]